MATNRLVIIKNMLGSAARQYYIPNSGYGKWIA